MGEAAICSEVPTSSFPRSHVQMRNSRAPRSHTTASLGLHMKPVDLESIRVLIYANAPFANNAYHSTELGYLFVLTDDSSRDISVYFSSFKSLRVVRSVLGGDLYALTDVANLAIVLRRYMSVAPSRDVLVAFLRESLSFFNVVIRPSTITTAKRLIIDIASMR